MITLTPLHAPRAQTMRRSSWLFGVSLLALLALGCEGESPPVSAESGGGDVPESSAGEPMLATSRAAPRDGSFSLSLPADLLVQPFASTLMGTSADGTYRVFVEARRTSLLEALGQLKDELIGLGFEVAEERHFEAATLLTLGQGGARNRVERAIWLVQAAPDLTLLCDGLARAYAVARLHTTHRAVCQTLTTSPRSPE